MVGDSGPEVFAIGDMISLDDLPGVAQPAIQEGRFVARTIRARLRGRGKRKPFHYFDKGDMATIGRMAAVAKVEWPFKAHMSGLPAWATWLTVHIFFLIGFRNRLVVATEWLWSYVTYQRGARLITGEPD